MQSEIIFTLISLISASLALLITFPLVILMINHLRKKPDVVLLLMVNSYITMFAHCLLVLLVNINVLRADLYGPINANISDSSACRLQSFLLYVTFSWCYASFILQAFYRFARVLYAKRKIFQTYKFNLILITLQWIVGFLIHLPIYVWPVPIYTLYQMDYYCGIPYEKLGSTIYVEINIHLTPIIFLRTIYARLMCFIRHQSPQQLQTQQGKKIQRDFVVIRRILLLVNLLTLPIIQNVVFAIMSMVNPSVAGNYYMYRIQFMGSVVVMFILSIVLVIMTPQLKTLVTTGTVHFENQVEQMGQTITDQRTPIPTAANRF